MYTLLISPLLDELSPLVLAFQDMGFSPVSKDVGNLSVYEIKELGLLLTQGGHGKAQFAIQTQHLLDQIQNVSLVICAGAAGGISRSAAVGDIVVATATIEHDYTGRFSKRPLPSFDGSLEHLRMLQSFDYSKNTFKIHFEKIASGDEDVIDPERAQELHDLTSAIAVAWEGAGGARASRFMKIPYLEIRGITDNADHDARNDFYKNLDLVMPRIASLVSVLQKNL